MSKGRLKRAVARTGSATERKPKENYHFLLALAARRNITGDQVSAGTARVCQGAARTGNSQDSVLPLAELRRAGGGFPTHKQALFSRAKTSPARGYLFGLVSVR